MFDNTIRKGGAIISDQFNGETNDQGTTHGDMGVRTPSGVSENIGPRKVRATSRANQVSSFLWNCKVHKYD